MTSELWIGAPNNWASIAAMWSLAAQPDGGPLLPGTTSCGQGCRGVVNVYNNVTWSANQEFFGIAHASKAVIPRDSKGQWAERIDTVVKGPQNDTIIVTAYQTPASNSADFNRYSLVVLNFDDGASSSGGWNPQPARVTIQFRGVQASYAFPVGLTTLSWYALGPTSA